MLGWFERFWWRLSRCGYRASATSLWVHQPGGWVELPRDQIAAVKVCSVSHVIVRLYDGRRYVLDLFRFGGAAFEAVLAGLDQAQRENQRRRARRGRNVQD
jgi:hypothetical protein